MHPALQFHEIQPLGPSYRAEAEGLCSGSSLMTHIPRVIGSSPHGYVLQSWPRDFIICFLAKSFLLLQQLVRGILWDDLLCMALLQGEDVPFCPVLLS